MDKEKALEDFFRSLKLVSKNVSVYSATHPAFIQSIEKLKKKIDALLNFLSPVKIGFTPQSLHIDGKHFEKEKIYEELAQSFHYRRIKSIEIRKGVSVEELKAFLTKVYLSLKDILKEGGLRHILDKEDISHIEVEELDYFELLKGEGEEIKGIWPYLLQEAVEQKDNRKIIEIADNFERFVEHSKAKDYIEDKELKGNIDKLFVHLKKKEKEKFRKCSKDLLKSVVTSKDISKETRVEEMKTLFEDLSPEDLASTLAEEIFTDDNFDSLSFQLFSTLTKKKHKKIASSFKKQTQEKKFLIRSPRTRQKLKELMTGSTGAVISGIYRQTLSSLLKDKSSEELLTIDPKLTQKNYRFVLLNLLDEEKRKKRLISILEQILGEWESISNEKDLKYLKNLMQVLERRKSDLSTEQAYIDINKNLLSFLVDRVASDGVISPKLRDFTDYLKESFVSTKSCLDKIFMEDKVNPQILKLFFRFYPDKVNSLNRRLYERHSDTEFLKKIIESLKEVDSPLSLESLKHIFSFGNDLIKQEVLKVMQQMSTCDENFLLDVLEKESLPLRKEALRILRRNESTLEKAVEKLFSVSSPFGVKNQILLENIGIIEETELKEAEDMLIALSKNKFFWNKNLKREASKILEKWNERRD
jgi:hypothetical protein